MTYKTTLLAAAAACVTATASFASTVAESYAVTSAVGSNSDHSLWISGGLGNGLGSDLDFAPAGTFNFNDDGTGEMTGRVQSQDDATSGFVLSFNFSSIFPDGEDPAFKPENGSTHGDDLRLIDLTGGTLIGFGALAGLDLDVTRRPADFRFATQFGSAGDSPVGPNNKNGNFGMAFWMTLNFADSCLICDDYARLDQRQADINVDLTIQELPAEVPVPAAGLLLLSAIGGAAGLRRRRKS